MAQDNLLGITNSLFGTAPTAQSDLEFGLKNIAGKSATELGTAMAYAGGRQATRGLLNVMGAEDPSQAEANKFKAAVQQANQQGVDTTTSQGMKQVVSILMNSGESALAQKAVVLAQAMEQKELDMSRTRAETGKITNSIEMDAKLRSELAALGANPTEDQVLSVVTKYGNPDRILTALTASRDRQAMLDFRRDALAAKGDGSPRAGYDKKGAYTNEFGEVFNPTEMAKQRGGFEQGIKLLSRLNAITDKDIREAEGWNWTSGDTAKYIGGKIAATTLSAQAKVNAAQLLEQLKNLPPGSASDKDMAASKASFPGYGNAKNLENWVKETRRTLQESLDRQSQQFGFRQGTPTSPVAPPGGEAPPADGKKRIKFNDM